jgi:hypothetical protein
MIGNSVPNQHLEKAKAQYAEADLRNSVISALADLLRREMGNSGGQVPQQWPYASSVSLYEVERFLEARVGAWSERMRRYLFAHLSDILGRPLCQRPPVGLRLFACPRDRGGDIPILNSQLGEASPHLIRAALLQRAQDDARPVGAYVKILHPGEAGDHFFGKSDLVLGSFFSKHGYLF